MRKESFGTVFGLFRIAVLIWSLEALDLNSYYADRLVVSDIKNGTGMEYIASALSREDAIVKFSSVSPNCSFLDPNDITEVSCDKIDADYCESKKNLNETWTSYKFQRNDCECFVDTCDGASSNETATVLYPGCLCDKTVPQCDLNIDKECHYWNQESTTDHLKFEAFQGKHRKENKDEFIWFIQTGHPTLIFNRETTSIVTNFFKQSGINCTLKFWHHLTPQSPLSRVSVRVHMLDGQSKSLFEYRASQIDPTVWRPEAVTIGSYSQPFRISIDCETGSIPKKSKMLKGLRAPYSCSLRTIEFENCQDIRNPEPQCTGPTDFMCSVPWNTKCLKDIQCDLRMNCDDGADEADCGEIMAPGSMCDFNSPPEFCPGWFQITRISEFQESQFEPTTLAPLNKLDATPIYLMRIRNPSSKMSINREPWRGAGKMLIYESVEARKLSGRTSILVSPPFPRTNPAAYDKNSKYYKTCQLRFWLCARTYLTNWHISIISKANNPFDSGKTTIFDPRVYYGDEVPVAPVCDWKRVHVPVPRQNGGYRLGIFVEHQFDREDFFGIDDLSFSPTCFEKNVNQSTWDTPDLLISTCGASGFHSPTQCDKFRALDGQTGHFVKEDGSQEWTVTSAGFYRIEACGASGGSTEYTPGDKGECLTLQVHLLENIAIRMLIGQTGEAGCIADSDDPLDPDPKFTSCAKTSHLKRENREVGAGGGGATLLKVEANVWNVVAGGGAGASWDDGDANAGYGASVIPVTIDPQCKNTCRSVSHTDFIVEKSMNHCPNRGENQTTVLGGFGGGGNSCGLLGGSGAGYRAGNPFGSGRERSGSSNVTENFSKEVIYYQAEKREEGFIKISFCRKQCTLPFVCKFGNDKFDEEYCGCPDGNNKSETCECPLDCPSASTCQYRNFTYEPFCMCNNGKIIEDFSTEECEEAQPWSWYNYLFFILFLFLIAGAFIVAFHYRNRTEQMKQEIIDMKQLTTNIFLYDDVYFGPVKRKDALEKLPVLDREDVEIGRLLGTGNFGEVLYGKIAETSVAVKTISRLHSNDAAAQMDFCNEALCMGTFVHENIVKLIGYNFEQLPYIIVIEYMEGGDLLSFLKDARPNQISLNPFQLTISDLIGLAHGVAAGCQCLEEFKYVHRDIAARNILLTTRGHGRVAKIADFGMAKDISERISDYYRISGRAMLPLKWTPPEAFIDGVFSSKSDVWSFGILCWEVFSLGVSPYPNRRNEEVMLMLIEGARLEYPYGIPTRVYQLMRDCWRTHSIIRPTFVEIVETLEDIMKDPFSVGMPFPIHPSVRTSYVHAQSTPVSVETPMTAVTDVSSSSGFTDASTVKISAQHDVQDRIQLHELMLTREQPYISERATCFIDTIRRDLARAQYEGTTIVPDPRYLSPQSSQSTDESARLIRNESVLIDQTPPSSLIDLNRLAVQNTGPTLHRPDSLNFNDQQCMIPLLECQTR